MATFLEWSKLGPLFALADEAEDAGFEPDREVTAEYFGGYGLDLGNPAHRFAALQSVVIARDFVLQFVTQVAGKALTRNEQFELSWAQVAVTRAGNQLLAELRLFVPVEVLEGRVRREPLDFGENDLSGLLWEQLVEPILELLATWSSVVAGGEAAQAAADERIEATARQAMMGNEQQEVLLYAFASLVALLRLVPRAFDLAKPDPPEVSELIAHAVALAARPLIAAIPLDLRRAYGI